MAKTTRSATASKAQNGKTAARVKDVKKGKSKVVPSKGSAAKRTVKVAAKSIGKVAKVAGKRVAKPATPNKAAAKPAASKKTLVRPAAVKKAMAKPAAAKKAAVKPAARKAVVKQPSKKAGTVSKPIAAKGAATVKKTAANKTVARKVVPTKAAAEKGAVRNTGHRGTPARKSALKKPAAAAEKIARPVAQPAGPAKAPAKTAPGKSMGKVVTDQPVKTVSPSPTTSLFKGKVASATAMVTPRPASASGHHGSPHANQKNSSSSMNKPASKKLDSGVTREDGRYALPATSTIALPKGYHPSNNEEYMNPQHLAYFRNKLRDWRDQLVEESRQTMDNLRDEVRDVGDEAERATRETENSLELRTRDRYRKLISKIDKALRRIEEGSYGFCEETDEEIGIDRLDARPIATLSLDAQERREHLQKQMGD
jgi:DnaK suppressor protein